MACFQSGAIWSSNLCDQWSKCQITSTALKCQQQLCFANSTCNSLEWKPANDTPPRICQLREWNADKADCDIRRHIYAKLIDPRESCN